MVIKRIKVLTLFTAMSLLPAFTVGEAAAASNLMDFLRERKEQKQQVIEAPQPAAPPRIMQPPRPKENVPMEPRVQKTAPVKAPKQVDDSPRVQASEQRKVSVPTPRVSNYVPEGLVKVDFAKVDFQQTSAVRNPFATLQPYAALSTAVEGFSVPSATVAIARPDFDQEKAEKLQKQLSVIELRSEKPVAEALLKFYANEAKLLWVQDGQVSAQAKALIAQMEKADEDGLDPAEYAVSLPDESLTDDAREQALVAFDVTLSARVLRYVRDGAEGRIIADRLSSFHDLPRRKLDLVDVMKRLAGTDKPDEVTQSYFPQSNWYLALKLALAEMDEKPSTKIGRVKADTVIRPGQDNAELPKILALIGKKAPATYLESHKDVLERHKVSTLYDPELVDAIKDYQKVTGRSADGVIGPATINALQGVPNVAKRERIMLALERLRWLPDDFTKRYVFVNQPAYQAQYFENGAEKLAMKVVVGNPRTQTSFFYDEIRLVTFNPSWGVPRSIMLNEMLPRIRKDPSYLARNGYALYDKRGKKLSASDVDWANVGAHSSLGVRQLPGDGNALGELKILFPNKHDIYLHDTPNKSAFGRDMRAISHGCVRLENPRAMAAAVMGKDTKDLEPYFKRKENSVNLQVKVPVYLVYFTAWPDAKTGNIQYYDDVYGRDTLMVEAAEKIARVRLASM